MTTGCSEGYHSISYTCIPNELLLYSVMILPRLIQPVGCTLAVLHNNCTFFLASFSTRSYLSTNQKPSSFFRSSFLLHILNQQSCKSRLDVPITPKWSLQNIICTSAWILWKSTHWNCSARLRIAIISSNIQNLQATEFNQTITTCGHSSYYSAIQHALQLDNQPAIVCTAR